jgi:hypothetical protein
MNPNRAQSVYEQWELQEIMRTMKWEVQPPRHSSLQLVKEKWGSGKDYSMMIFYLINDLTQLHEGIYSAKYYDNVYV